MNTHRPIQAVVALLTLSLALSLLSHPAEARTWLVEPDGSGDAPTIQAAADSSAMGDSILVQPGMYVEQVVLADGTSLIGSAGAAATTIDGDGVGFAVRGVDILVQGLKLIGVTGNGYGYGGYAVYANGESEVRGCMIDDSWGGVFTRDDVTVSNSEFRNGGYLPAVHLLISSSFGSVQISDCLFEAWTGTASVLLEDQEGYDGATVSGDVRDCVFRDCISSGIVGYVVFGNHPISDAVLVVEDNLFDQCNSNEHGLVGPLSLPILGGPRRGSFHTADVLIRGNTFVRNVDGGLGNVRWPELDPGTVIENNVIVGNAWGVALPSGGGVTVSCNLLWGNDQDWSGIADPEVVDANLVQPPLFCDFAGGGFTAAGNSPLLAANNGCGVQIGAFGQGCGPISVIQTTWARIKGMYRE